MEDKSQKLVDNAEFQEFLNREFDSVAAWASVEELSEFAFGSLEEAIEAFEEHNRTHKG